MKTNKIKKDVNFIIRDISPSQKIDIQGQIINFKKNIMENQESGLQEIKTELDNLNAKLFNLSNELYTQTANLCGEFNRPVNEKLHEEVGDFYMDIFKGQTGFQMSIIDEIVNTLNHLKSATNK